MEDRRSRIGNPLSSIVDPRKAMPWRRLILTLLAILLLIGLLAYGFRRDPRYIPSPIIGRPAPRFTLTLFNGGQLDLASLRGKVVFVNFWASWCSPCRAEASEMEAAWQTLKGSDVVFLGVNIQDQEENALTFLREFNITYANGRDATGKIAIDYGVWGIPETFFIDSEGRITYKHVGELAPTLITAKLDEARRRIVSAKEGTGSHLSIK